MTMPPNPELIDALQKRDIDDLQKAIAEGFKGIHTRQDVTNGRIGKAEGNITDLEKINIRRDERQKYEKLIWYLFTVAVGVIVGLTSFIIYRR